MRSLRTGLLGCLVFLLSGCVIVPVPLVGYTGRTKGIGETTVEFLEVGKTTKEEIFLQLGAPYTFTEDTISYPIEKYGWALLWGWTIARGVGDIGVSTSKTLGILSIKFGASSVVEEYHFTDDSSQWRTYCSGTVLCSHGSPF